MSIETVTKVEIHIKALEKEIRENPWNVGNKNEARQQALDECKRVLKKLKK